MRAVFTIPLILLFSCTGNGTDKRGDSKTCACDQRQEQDTVFFATDVLLQEVDGKMVISYHCADIATAIASVSGVNGEEQCENLYERQCVSARRDSLMLSDRFTYFSEEMKEMHLSGSGSQNLFFEALKNKATAYFEFTAGNKELRAITKIKI